ncbi:hypothetical protein [Pseudomonas oryzihabitans]|uniref:hypothetical protein n=1 Tax=Pseudomonas oryzihabitans TaxID=47885 RepID=UPI002895ECFA|nr:hypothetical protein [Pseudomonas oryzihabitans]MDT3720668.1 hypothetical protein [Pseudomonas oryzihabitans]
MDVPDDVRISAGSVPVKDRYRKKGRVIGKNWGCIAPKKNAASEGALRRVGQKAWDSLREANDRMGMRFNLIGIDKLP